MGAAHGYSKNDERRLSSTSAAETAALALGAQKANYILELLSYLTPGDPNLPWDNTPP